MTSAAVGVLLLLHQLQSSQYDLGRDEKEEETNLVILAGDGAREATRRLSRLPGTAVSQCGIRHRRVSHVEARESEEKKKEKREKEETATTTTRKAAVQLEREERQATIQAKRQTTRKETKVQHRLLPPRLLSLDLKIELLDQPESCVPRFDQAELPPQVGELERNAYAA